MRIFYLTGRRASLLPLYGIAAVLLCALRNGAAGAEPLAVPPPARVLTNISEIWSVPREEKDLPHPIRTEVIIYYFDPAWNTASGECMGVPGWLPLADSPVPLKPWQRVAIDGEIIPSSQRLVWDRTRVRVVEEHVAVKAEPLDSLTDRSREVHGHLVQVEGLVENEVDDATHMTFTLLRGPTAATVHMLKEPGAPPPAFKDGDFVRLKCVHAPQFDRDGKVENLVLWVTSAADVTTIGSLQTDRRFATPVRPVDQISTETPVGEVYHVDGYVRSHEPGKWVTIWDATGQVMVQSRQTRALRRGDHIEAVGYPLVLGVKRCLTDGFYRFSVSTNTCGIDSVGEAGTLRLAEQVREISAERASNRVPVLLFAAVTWAHPQKPVAFVQDASGGIRLMNPTWETPDASKPGSLVLVQGTTCQGDFVPAITNVVVRKTGWWNQQEGRNVTLEQALTGVDDGSWIQMRGFVVAVTNENALTRLTLSTTSGEFEALLPASKSLESMIGSIIRIEGVCSTIANFKHQLTSVEIWSPDPRDIQVDEPAPDDLFAAPLRSLESLRRFSLLNALDQRIRTRGTVVLHKPGRYLYVQDGADGLYVLSRQSNPLQPGQRVEVVGFPGNAGRRFLLREAVYRLVSSDAEPLPARIPTAAAIDFSLEGRLARAQGVLLNASGNDGEIRILVQTGDSPFEATLDATDPLSGKLLRNLQLGSTVALTGVYEVRSDEYGKPRSFVLRLRAWSDIHVLQLPSWWTLPRLLWALGGVLAVSFIALSWGVIISRKNRQLRHAQADLRLANDQLEVRVEERTRELKEQVVARERAHFELAQAQEHLVLTSRQAGMAEVATGVLHNVGNVLNSVNISAGILSDRLRRSAVESVSKVATLLKAQGATIGEFLNQNPKGKSLPGYLDKLGTVLAQDKQEMLQELKSLAKNIDHIKTIITMQQGYAKVGGVVEELDARDLVEDAVQINSASLERKEILLNRDYHPVRRVLVDRHKVLQILVNLISNAKHALEQKTDGRLLTLSIDTSGPNRVRITVTDNGVGIAPENLTRIFSQGFTTRKDGHGFGLHSGAQTARELNGSLTVASQGLGHGATFALELPAANSSPDLSPDRRKITAKRSPRTTV